MIKLAVFDCDGTLVDSQANICRAMEDAFLLADIPAPPRAAIRRIVGLSLVEAIRALLPHADDAQHRRMAADYKDAFFRLRTSGELAEEPLFDGIAGVLQALVDDGWRLGVATGKSDRGLAHILDHHGLAHHFVTLQTADRHPSKPDPAMLLAAMDEAGATPQNTAMIGDTSFDMAMGKAAGARAIGVAWGYHGIRDLADAGADVVAERVSALPGLLA
ncbi:HAD-IA family hydrolase [Sphingomonadaceae bacterium OTU29MARTA1]|uniref:HAD-IA family hydrolase n=1 Tax=Sphingomonas sp. Leaf37 TaxID=2876552 RepID=UPI001E517C3D|nr:HAD-IA family hydrolase [Sphingomonas sp. Leaf37]USU05084.1 HAD-IA family hydrolase [Sphingomonadaceae bacterium OTU29LAMAA1]USU08729.1 HAD-IA family hydrolase [Sphingomonadaceae bacterium OTU29MARTA1]